jgi:hypothetical protein
MTNTLQERDVVVMYLLGFLTLGIYFIYWYIESKTEINENFGTDIPTCWLLIIPIANIYWMYKFAEAYSLYIIRDDNKALWALLFIFVTIIVPAVVQIELNKFVGKPMPPRFVTRTTDRRCPDCGRYIPDDAKVCPYCAKRFQEFI